MYNHCTIGRVHHIITNDYQLNKFHLLGVIDNLMKNNNSKVVPSLVVCAYDNDSADYLVDCLQTIGISAESIDYRKSVKEKTRLKRMFNRGDIRVLVTTTKILKIKISKVDYIINYDMFIPNVSCKPNDVYHYFSSENYYLK